MLGRRPHLSAESLPAAHTAAQQPLATHSPTAPCPTRCSSGGASYPHLTHTTASQRHFQLSIARRQHVRSHASAAAVPAEISQAPVAKTFDVVHLGNLCLDIIVQVDELPPPNTDVRAALLADLTATPPPETAWEVGAASNFMIAAARLGQRVASVGQLGADVYGEFFRSVLRDEGISVIEPLMPAGVTADPTLLCFILMGPASEHTFCSCYDFGPWPLLAGVTALQPRVLEVLANTRALMLNGFVLDELPGPLVVAAALQTRKAGGSVLFDPGPRSWTLLEGERRVALDAILDVADVVLMTQEEASAVTGEEDPAAAGAWVLGRPAAATSWAIIKLGSEGALLCARGAAGPIHIDALRVPVKDTVGCGDSFAAAVALGFTHGERPEATLALANAVGAATAMGRGAGRSVASADAVVALLEAQAQGLVDAAMDPAAVPYEVDTSPVPFSAAVTISNGGEAGSSAVSSGSDASGALSAATLQRQQTLSGSCNAVQAIDLLRQSLEADGG